MDKAEVLNEVNRLVAAGLRKSAIDIIQEYLEIIPNDQVMFRALGRIYLLEKKPNLAVKYLQLSLNNSHSEINKKDTTESYGLDDLNADDLTYIDEAAHSSENSYVYASEDTSDNLADTLTKQIPNTLISPPLSNTILSDQDNNLSNDSDHQSVTSGVVLTNSKSNHIQQGFVESNFSQKRNPILDIKDSVTTNKADSSHRQEDLFSTLFTSATSTENGQYDLFNDEEELSIDGFEDDEFETDEEEDILIISEFEDVLIEKEFNWDDLDDFEEIDEQETSDRFYYDQVLTEGKLDRQQRAKQIAVEVMQTYDWAKETLPLLQQVFYENGWAAARSAIEREMAKGLTQEELELALYIRSLWTENQQYWISFIHIESNQHGQQTRAAYKNMSWPESLRIIRSFNNVPSEEEIEYFVDELYDDWYCSAKLQRQYKAFIKYLKYRTGSVRRSLPGNEIFSFIDSYDKESLLDSGYHVIKQATGIEALKHERIDIERMLAGIEQKYAVIRPEGDFGDPAVYGDR